MKTLTIDEILSRSAKKLKEFSSYLTKKNGAQVRDGAAVAVTSNRILNSIQNFADSGYMGSGNFRLLNEAVIEGALNNFSRNGIKNFSATDNESVFDMDVVDISLGATIKSDALTYVAADRPMDAAKSSISFQGLVAMNDAGGFEEGSVVYDPRLAINNAINLGRDGGTGAFTVAANGVAEGSLTIAAGAKPGPIVANGVEIYIAEKAESGESAEAGEKKLIGFTSAMLPAEAGIQPVAWKDGSYFTEGSVNIKTGEFTGTVAQDLSGYTIYFQGCWDRPAERDGAHTLRLKPQVQTYLLEAKENLVFLENNLTTQAYMNKIYRENARMGLPVEYSKRALEQLVDIYTFYIDNGIFRELEAGTHKADVAALDVAPFDLTGYTASYSTFSTTKNDRILRFMNELQTKLLFRTNKPVTAYVVDDLAGKVLANDTDNFKVDAGFRMTRDGFIGYYSGVPVVRSSYLTGKSTNVTNGTVIGVHKSLDGEAAPVFFGEYLAPFSSVPSLNFLNPTQLAQSLMSFTGQKCIVPEFAVRSEIIAPAI